MTDKLAHIKSETYEVTFSLQERGKEFWEERKETVAFYSKGKEQVASKEIVNKYKGAGHKIKVIKVLYVER